MSRGIAVLQFQACQVRLWRPDFMDTYFFATGRATPALFVQDAQAQRTARDHGYGDDVLRMHREHDVAHTFLAESLGFPYSPVLFRLAGGPDTSPEERVAEEGRVLAFQRYLNTGDVSQPLQGLDVVTLQERFRALVFQSVQHAYCTVCGACLLCDSEDDCYDYGNQTMLDSAQHIWPRFD